MNGTLRDVIYALRVSAKQPAFSLLIVLTLAVGIGAATAMFSVLDQTLIRPLPFPEPDRLVIGRTTRAGGDPGSVSAPDFEDYRDSADAFESLAAIRSWVSQATVTGNGNGIGEPERINIISVSGTLFETLGVLPFIGRSFSAEEADQGAPVLVLSHAYFQRALGGLPSALGRSLTVDETRPGRSATTFRKCSRRSGAASRIGPLPTRPGT